MLKFIAGEIKGAWQQISPVHVSKFPAYLGRTVHQEEYDTLKTECDRERKSAQHWYEKYMKIEVDLRERLAKRDELITKLANDLQEANDAIEKMSIEIDTLQKRLARRKQSPRETGVRP